jgi:stearoyl-CoA desaturase (delta-9 desaturase)
MQPLIEISWPAWLLLALAVTQLTIFSVTVYLHRSQAHRALTLHPALAHFIRGWLWVTTGMSTRQWVAVHRKHHAHCETEQDPHSPAIKGFWTVMLHGARLYTKESRNEETLTRFGKGAPADWLEINLYSLRFRYGLVLLTALNVALFGLVKGGLLSTVQLLWIPLWAAGIINGLAHTKGYRNFPTPDRSKNLLPWGLWIGGEELHNNHHAHPTSAKLSCKPWEVDMGWGVIRGLEVLRLAQVHRAYSEPTLIPVPQACTAALVAAMGTHRMLVSEWSRALWLKTVAEVKKAERLTPAQATLLGNAFQNESLGTEALGLLEGRAPLLALRAKCMTLEHLWTDSVSSVEELARDLTAWCAQAEASGVEALVAMSHRIRRLPAPVSAVRTTVIG